MTNPDVDLENLRDWLGNPLPAAPSRILPSVTAFVQNDAGELLMLKRADNHHWAIPGGKMEIGESATQAVVREVQEETGVEVAVESLIGAYSDPAGGVVGSYPDGTVIHFVNLCFRCTPIGGALRGSDEGEEVGYFPLDDLPTPILPPHLLRLEDAQAGRGGSAFR